LRRKKQEQTNKAAAILPSNPRHSHLSSSSTSIFSQQRGKRQQSSGEESRRRLLLLLPFPIDRSILVVVCCGGWDLVRTMALPPCFFFDLPSETAANAPTPLAPRLLRLFLLFCSVMKDLVLFFGCKMKIE
jgi:hypothetical protein